MWLLRTLLVGWLVLSFTVERAVAAEPSPSETLLRQVPSETSIC